MTKFKWNKNKKKVVVEHRHKLKHKMQNWIGHKKKYDR